MKHKHIGRQEINAQTGTAYTLAEGDQGKLTTCTNGSAITVTVPQDSADEDIVVGDWFDIYQGGAGQVTVAAGSGATLRTGGATAKTLGQYATVRVQKVAADTYRVDGNVAAS